MKIGTRAASRSFEPSRGGTGIILKIARNRLRRAADTHRALTVSPECAATPSSTMAKSTLLAGPAIATSAKPFNPQRSLFGFVFTGLPQPMNPAPESDMISGSITVPSQSTWASGFSVTRPSRAGVSSPRRVATQAWANSCGVVRSQKIRTFSRALSISLRVRGIVRMRHYEDYRHRNPSSLPGHNRACRTYSMVMGAGPYRCGADRAGRDVSSSGGGKSHHSPLAGPGPAGPRSAVDRPALGRHVPGHLLQRLGRRRDARHQRHRHRAVGPGW